MQITNVTSPQWANAEHTMINVMVAHSEFGVIPFSASPDDVEEHGRAIFADAVAGKFGTIAEYVAPVIPAEPPSTSCSRRQGRLALLEFEKLDLVESAIAAIDDPALRRRAQIEYEADTWERSNLFLQSMWVTLGGTSEELDALFACAVTQ